MKPAMDVRDFADAAIALGVGIAEIRAFATVESRGKGFFPDDRPVILYEKHIFYREYVKKTTNAAKVKVRENNPNLTGPSLETLLTKATIECRNAADALVAKYPTIISTSSGGYKGGAAEYARLEQAIAIDHECALRSCSWGAFQIMGFHAEFLGYKDVFEFVEAMYESEKKQLDAFVKFIVKNPPLHNALKLRNWPLVAKYYNGPNYSINKYDVKLEAAFNTFNK